MALVVALLFAMCKRAEAPASAPAAADVPAEASTATALPDGHYRCYTYHPGAVFVGAIDIDGDRYKADRGGSSGRYTTNANGQVTFLGDAPLGFHAAVLEERQPVAKLRLYVETADIGNRWKAAMCTGGDAASPATSSPVTAAFAVGTRVEATYLGYWYAGLIIRCDGSRCLVHYDDPSSKDEWVDTSRLRARQ